MRHTANPRYDHEPTLWERLSNVRRPWWQFWHPGSGLAGALIFCILVLILAPAIWRTFFQ